MKTLGWNRFLVAPASLLIAGTALLAGDSWSAEQQRRRADKDREFLTSATSPMAGIARLSLGSGSPRVLATGQAGVEVSESSHPQAQGVLLQQQDRWFRQADAPPAPPLPLSAGDTWRIGRYTLLAYPAADALTLLVFDPQRPLLRRFRGLRYFPPVRAWAVPARLERLAQPVPVRMLTSRNLQKPFFRYATIRFRIGERELALSAFKSALEGEEAAVLFVPFKDLTNGKTTYEVGRFLDIPEPARDDLVLDFNSAYNPLCNYSPAYNCPMPPRENFLDIAVTAGERVYPHQ